MIMLWFVTVVFATALLLLSVSLFTNGLIIDNWTTAVIAAMLVHFVSWLVGPLVLSLGFVPRLSTWQLFVVDFALNTTIVFFVCSLMTGIQIRGSLAMPLVSAILTVAQWLVPFVQLSLRAS